MYPRILDPRTLARRKSIFLFGPRSTGKTTLLRSHFDDRSIINLLRSAVFLSLSRNPSQLADMAREIRRTSDTCPTSPAL